MQGLFISVEGIDGVGKSTHVKFIETYMQEQGFKTITTREPGGTELGEKFRALLLSNKSHMHRITELLLMFASRQELIANVIEPNLKQGVCVISDRYIDASIAYQGLGRKIGVDKLNSIISLLEPLLIPDLTLLFDAPVDLTFSRVGRHSEKDRIEQEDKSFFLDVQQAYYTIAKNEEHRVKIIRTDQHKEQTRMIIKKHLDNLIATKKVNS
ncbi:MAG: dTMP kinase [Burkholderiales bacterium]|nr:dTMP kinase [Burkholderiales bacterium]